MPHALDRPAVRWRREGLWLWHSIWIPAAIGSRRRELDGRDVLADPNAEQRRVIGEGMGVDRFMDTTGAMVVQQDDYGRLWRLDEDRHRAFRGGRGCERDRRAGRVAVALLPARATEHPNGPAGGCLDVRLRRSRRLRPARGS